MRTEWLAIGPVPVQEDCLQVGSASKRAMVEECRRFRDGLERYWAPLAGSLRLDVVGQDHDLGRYYEVHARWDAGDHAAEDMAYRIEADSPGTWDALEAEG